MAPGELDRLMTELKAWCKAHHGEQKKLAEKLGVTPQVLNHWIARRKDPGLKNYLAIQEFMEQTKPKAKKSRSQPL